MIELSTCGDLKWHSSATQIANQVIERFYDQRAGGFYFTDRSASDLIIRQKTASDSPLPSGNAIAARIMLELGHADIVRDTIALFAPQLEAHGEGMEAMVLAAIEYVQANGPSRSNQARAIGREISPPSSRPNPSSRSRRAGKLRYDCCFM